VLQNFEQQQRAYRYESAVCFGTSNGDRVRTVIMNAWCVTELRVVTKSVPYRRLLVLLFCLLLPWVPLAAELTALVYHDIVSGTTTDDYAVSVVAFREQMDTLKRLGYQPVSLRTLADGEKGRAVLPHKAVLLTFDDGLVSFRQHALPVLEEYGFPAVVALETGWLDGRDVPENYQGRMLSWEDVRAIQRSPLVEIASHTDDLHHGIPSNPQGNQAPASITRRYDSNTKTYESESAFRRRIRVDLVHFAQRLKAETRSTASAIAWPYGHLDSVLAEEAQALGMHWQLTLGLMPARTEDFPRISRILVYKAHTLADFERLLLKPPGFAPHRFLEVELDAWSSMTETERERQLSALLARLELLRVNTVIISPFTRDARYALFANSGMPSAGDFLNRALHQMRTRVGVRQIVLRLPTADLSAAVYAELARRHPYDGILVSKGVAPQVVTAARARFAYYRPGLVCGIEGQVSVPGCTDFRLVSIDPEQRFAPEGEKPDPTPVYYLLQNGPDLKGRQLVASIRALNRGGARNFGLRNSTALDDPGTLTRVTVELANLTDSRY
jgi:peptidoglycan/xylan/chitin deacetylase (PgdA/CDA1 family)